MRAVGINRFGGPEVLEVVDLPDPVPAEGQVRIRVAAATINPTDIGMRTGMRAAAFEKLEAPYVPGMELAGTVDQVGPGSRWVQGDRVMAIVLPMATGRGAQSELVVVPDESVALMPKGSTFAEAATLPMNGLTVRRALDVLDLEPGQTLVVTGAAGAVGGYGVQLGAEEGLRVLAVAGAADKELVTDLGAEHFVERGPDAVSGIRQLLPEGADGLLDAAVIGGPILGAVRDGGRLASVRPFQGETERGITIDLVLVSEYARDHAALDRLGRLVETGKLTLRVAETFPPEMATEAHRKFEAGGVRGPGGLRGRLVIVF